ncbi:MAG: prolipoprotein diacylglyceryl transferase [Bacteroidales bacterium]|jgi:prolipoprotein diacylglyceryl transferase|nr:prolipoprotein diacylglyceryl transferase [Bacteroidales bacterium]MDD3384958.1 prolipoprotein diacylglyceryl transferase [Bacteroidales bacterium]MDD4811938.1 prolipoprotein diacylglyceryl transferase [Bacteroidales bacterium]NLO68739.1 prolipoprotein diacylglyceryl transferase [Bacteroidales bacterium]
MEPTNGIIWDVDPIMFQIGTWTVRWYGLLFASAFVCGIILVSKMFKFDGVNRDWIDSMFLYVVIGTVIGARLGHVFFYDWAYYKVNPSEILKIWHGGLASHGGAIGIVLMLWLWSRKYSKKSIFWALDRVVIPAALAGVFIRTGNLINSEIYGNPTSVPWAFIFIREDNIPRHPTQIYEALGYLTIFLLLMYLFFKTETRFKEGRIFGLFMLLVFGFRFFIEFLKADQVAFEANMQLNMGQWLSLPLALVGLFFLLWKRKTKSEVPGKQTVEKTAKRTHD